jgi:hypothetical protein
VVNHIRREVFRQFGFCTQILEPIRDKLSQEKENDLLADINQIIGLCDIIDNTAFLPIQSDDLSPKYARRVNNFFDVIDNVVEELKNTKWQMLKAYVLQV